MLLKFISRATRLTVLSLAGLALQAMLASTAAAAPFSNGSFESPGGATEVSLDGNPTYVTGWTATGSGMFYEGPGNSHGWTAHTGSYGVSFGHNGTFGGTLSQTFDTVPGRRYTVTYHISRIQGGTSAQAMAVEAYDAATSTLIRDTGSFIPGANNVWVQGATLTFVAASNSTELRFKDNSGFLSGQGADSNWALDTVRVAEAPATVLQTLHGFAETGASPQAALLKGSDGNFYGTTTGGGTGGRGTVFKLSPSANGFETTILHSFAAAGSNNTDGETPHSELIQGSDGSLYGVANTGGAANCGTVFRLTPSGDPTGFTFSTIHTFDIANRHPVGRLLQMPDGSFYGTTGNGGQNDQGTIYKLTPDGNGGFSFARLYSFADSTSGYGPVAGLTRGTDGNLYGAASSGGPRDQFGNGGQGTVFRIAPDGTGFTVLHSFRFTPDGRFINAELLQASDGDFYGVAYAGGTEDAGTIFKITAGGTFTVLHTFTYTNKANGLFPNGSLVQDADGTFYGTTSQGGDSTTTENGHGTVFKMTMSGGTATVTTLHRFDGASQGREPQAGVILGGDGFLYGTTAYNGLGRGTAFRLSLDGTTFETLTRFASLGGKNPGELMQAADGNFYGTTIAGGAEEKGTIFKLTPAGVKTIVHSFSGPDGAEPRAALVQGRDGNLYGTTEFGGGPDDAGTLFKLTPSGDGSTFTFKLLYTFNYTEGGYSAAPLIEDRNTAGVFYGVGQYGGTSSRGNGIVFKATITGDSAAITVLHNMDGEDGAYPAGKLVQGTDGTLYGTAPYGLDGRDSHGTIFKVAPDGTGFAVLHKFTGDADGAYNVGGLWPAPDGSFYGTTGEAGPGVDGSGTIYRLVPNAERTSYTLTTLHTFSLQAGREAIGELVQGSDGDLYGTTYSGGIEPGYVGTLFKLSLADGSVTQLHAFTGGADGGRPTGTLVAGSDGHLYGTTEAFGPSGAGTVFRLVLQPVITSALTAANQVGGTFSYQVTSVRGATSYSASGLPLGLTLDTSTGQISGRAECAGTYSVQLTAANAAGSDTKTLTITIAPPQAPVMTGPAEGARTRGTPLFTGTSEPGTTILLTIIGGSSPVTATTTADSNGNFSVNSPELGEGSYSVSAVVRFCNDTESSAASNSRSFVVDRTPPVITATDIVAYNQSGDGANVSFAVSATDSADGQVNVTTDRASGSFFPIGTTTVTATASDVAGNTATRTFTVTVRETEMANISTRVPVGSGDNEAGIGGFIVQGSGLRRIIVRAIGPSMNAGGEPVPNRLENPTLQLFRSGSDEPIATNDDWQASADAGRVSGAGLAPNDPRESAILADLPEGSYTAVIRGADGSSGNALVEVYAVLTDGPAFLGNISTRGLVQTGDNVLIGGVIVRGTEPQRLLFRAIGPDLENRDVSGALQDPTLALFDENGERLAFSDDWREDEEEVNETNMPPKDDRESAIVQTLGAGNYTAVVRGKEDSTGVALVEVFAVDGAGGQ